MFNKYNELLRMLLVCVRSSLKSLLRYNFLILDTYHPNTLYLREQDCEDPWLFLESEIGPRAKPFGKYCSRLFCNGFRIDKKEFVSLATRVSKL